MLSNHELSNQELFALEQKLVGLYGTMAYAVRSRTAEIGVRLALGSTPAAAVRLVLREAWWCVAIGLGIP